MTICIFNSKKVVDLLWKVCSIDVTVRGSDGRIIGAAKDNRDHVKVVHVEELLGYVITTPVNKHIWLTCDIFI